MSKAKKMIEAARVLSGEILHDKKFGGSWFNETPNLWDVRIELMRVDRTTEQTRKQARTYLSILVFACVTGAVVVR